MSAMIANAILNRICMQRCDMLSSYGPEAVLNAANEVAEFVGNVEEIGTSDVSGWVKSVEARLLMQ